MENPSKNIHTTLQLLQQGYKVRTTLRSQHRKQEVLDMLINGGITRTQASGLEFIETDLTRDDNWDKAVEQSRLLASRPGRWPTGKSAWRPSSAKRQEPFSFAFKKRFRHAPTELLKNP